MMNKDQLLRGLGSILKGFDEGMDEDAYGGTWKLITELLGEKAAADFSNSINATDGSFYWCGEYPDVTRRGFTETWGLS